ncbi:MAG: choice-of-anchor Q domain-containing protein [Cyanobacteria bacterium P01_A01_bin.137]
MYSEYNNTENITINSSTISGNTTINDEGGALWSGYANVEINDSTISGNSSATDGGALWAYGGTLTINNSTISGNTSDDEGGGLYIGNSTSTITNSTISSNVATNGGGGGIKGVDSQIEIVNSTISGNIAANSNGGGIDGAGGGWSGGAATIQLTNSTVVNNTATTGGGIHEGVVTSNNSIIAGNMATVTDPDVSGAFTSNGTNLIGDLTGSAGFNANEELTIPIGEVLNTTLADNGGPSQTHALVANSPAIDAGSDDVAPTTDQRMLGRVGTADIGAFEYGALPDLMIVSGDSQTTNVNAPFDTPLQVLVTDANGDPYSNTNVTFMLPSAGASGSFNGASSYTAMTDGDGLVTTPTVTANDTSGSFVVTVTIDGLGTLALDAVEAAQFTLTTDAVAPVAPAIPAAPATSILDGPPESQPVESPVANICVPEVNLDTREVSNGEFSDIETETSETVETCL